MIKFRIIPTLLYKNYGLVKGVGFDSWRRVGGVLQAVKVYSMRGVDEMVFFDITATQEGRSPDFALIDDFADECFMPLAVGGGVKTVEDVQKLLQCGADKVVINSAAVLTPNIIRDCAGRFGSQCVVCSIDAKEVAEGRYEAYIYSGTKPTGRDPLELAKEMERAGAGEILLTSIDRDGTMSGYDLKMVKRIAEAVSIPVIASGGAGNVEDVYKVIGEGKASAVAVASIFYFTEITPLMIKEFLGEKGIKVRL